MGDLIAIQSQCCAGLSENKKWPGGDGYSASSGKELFSELTISPVHDGYHHHNHYDLTVMVNSA